MRRSTITSPPSARRVLGLIAVLAVVALTAGCGSGAPAESTAPPTAEGRGEAFPVTIDHALGSTTIPAEPRRVVAVGYTDQEPLLALGVRPLGAMVCFGDGTYGRWPWERRAWAGRPAEVVSTNAGEIDLERVAALRPDLILALYAELDRGQYDKLSQIAPTVAQAAEGDAYTTPWQAMTRVAARAVGRTAEGERLIRRTEAGFAAFRAAHPNVAGRTALVIDAGDAPKSYYPFTSTDPRGRFVAALGYRGSDAIDRLADNGFGTQVARERVDLLDVDRLFLLIDPPARARLRGDALFGRLDVAREGRVTYLPYYSASQIGAAVAFNSVLSIPYALKGIAARLDRGSGR
jgi:iron complex transport system substrate-binding protein